MVRYFPVDRSFNQTTCLQLFVHDRQFLHLRNFCYGWRYSAYIHLNHIKRQSQDKPPLTINNRSARQNFIVYYSHQRPSTSIFYWLYSKGIRVATVYPIINSNLALKTTTLLYLISIIAFLFISTAVFLPPICCWSNKL